MPPRTPLLDPGTYFETHPDPISAGLGVFAAYLIGSIVLAYGLIRLLLARTEDIPSEAVDLMFNLFWGVAFWTIPVSIIALFVVAGVMHFWVRNDAQFGSFGGALAVAAWSYAPEAIAAVVNFVVVVGTVSQRTFDASDPEVFAAQVEAVQAGIGPLRFIMPLLIVIWSIYILAWGIEASHDVSRAETLTPAILIGLGSLLLQLIA